MRLVALTIAWLGGIWLGPVLWSRQVLGCHQTLWPLALVVLALLALAWLERGHFVGKSALLVALLACGVARYGVQPLANCPDPATVSFYNGSATRPAWVTAEGIIDAYPDQRDKQTLYHLRVERLLVQGRAVPGRGLLLVQSTREPGWSYGDRVNVTGLLEAPPVFADFDYQAYLARQGIYSILRRPRMQLLTHGQGSPLFQVLYHLRAASSQALERSLPEPGAALAEGILLGIEGNIPDDLDQAFRETGTAHIVVISGSNVALLAGMLLLGLRRPLGARPAALVTCCVIAAYVLLVGAQPATLRAGIMGSLCALAIVFGRQNTPVVLLAASALLMTALDPRILWDIGFQLSVLATLGLILLSPPFHRGLATWVDRRWPGSSLAASASTLLGPLVVTLAAQVMTLPLLVYYFGRASLVSPLANLLILPVQPPLLAAGLVQIAAGLVWLPLGQWVGAVPWLFLSYTVEIVRVLARMPQASIDLAPWNRELALTSYGLLALAFAWRYLMRSPRRPSWLVGPPVRRRALAAAACCFLALGLLLTAAAAARPDGQMHLYFLPAGHGEGALVVGPDGNSALVWDGRGDPIELVHAVRTSLPIRRMPDVYLGPDSANPYPTVVRIDPTELVPGQRLQVGHGAVLERGGTTAPTFWLRYGEFATLVPAALDRATEEQLLARSQQQPRVTVLKAPGPATSAWPSVDLLRATAPQVVIWPYDTSYPPEVVALLSSHPVGRCEPENVIEVISDGKGFAVREYAAQAPR